MLWNLYDWGYRSFISASRILLRKIELCRGHNFKRFFLESLRLCVLELVLGAHQKRFQNVTNIAIVNPLFSYGGSELTSQLNVW